MNTFDYEYRVTYADTDRMGISYYANYLKWFESARTEYFRALGFPYVECEKKGLFLPVIEAHLKYHAPSTYDDVLVIRTSVAQLRKSSIRFEYHIFNKVTHRRLVSGYTVLAFVDKTFQLTYVPEEIEKVVTIHRLLDKDR
jgi:acyl-CoA thioester hydrolase